jgi:hypothetical protein
MSPEEGDLPATPSSEQRSTDADVRAEAPAPSAAPSSQRTATAVRTQRIRDAARWLVGSAAAVGAALIAGSQLSDIGQLPVGWPTDPAYARLWVAVAGAALALGAVVSTIWSAVTLMLPLDATIYDLHRAWLSKQGAEDGDGTGAAARPDLQSVVDFFRKNPSHFLGGFDTPGELLAAKERKRTAYAEAKAKVDQDKAKAAIADLDRRINNTMLVVESRYAEVRFAATSRRLLALAMLAAVGITLFAWAANPPPANLIASLRGADLSDAQLRDADLRGVDLRGADLTGADLLGADLSGADLTGATWGGTVCPDGTNSDQNGETCAGRLRP